MRTIRVFIKGMHCASCEKLVESEFIKVNGVKSVIVNRAEGYAIVGYKGDRLGIEELVKIGEKFGYEVSLQNKFTSAKAFDFVGWIWAVVIAALLVGLYKILQNFGVTQNFGVSGKNISLSVAFVIGIVASLSSCLAIVGAVVIAFAEKYRSTGKGFYNSALKPTLQFHLGRAVTFFLLGGFLGLIGGEISISGHFISIFTIVISLVMLWLGLSILGFLPSISDAGIRMPKGLTKSWDALAQSDHKLAPYLLGGLTFFLPCGFTQSMQIFALGSGSFLLGGFTLLLFALGTLPMLLIVGATASWAKSRKIEIVKKVGGILVVIFAIFMFLSGYALLGVRSGVVSNKKDDSAVIQKGAEPIVSPSTTANEQIVEMHVTARGFEPSAIRIKKNIPVRWNIYGDNLSGCTSKIIIPDLDISKDLDRGLNTLTFDPGEATTIGFSCWMGMVRGRFITD